jgi:hypothetical protein
MTRRRDFLGSVAGAAAWGASLPGAAAADTYRTRAPDASERVHLLIDPRSTESVAHGYSRTPAALAVHELPRAIGPQWARALFGRIARETAVLEATTSMADFFVLRAIAWDAGLRVTAEQAHGTLVTWTVS